MDAPVTLETSHTDEGCDSGDNSVPDAPNSDCSCESKADDTSSFDNDREMSCVSANSSSLTASTSRLLISSFISRHRLSSQAQADLLQLLQLQLHAEIPSSLYTFRNMSSSFSSISLVPTLHHYCPRCYRAHGPAEANQMWWGKRIASSLDSPPRGDP